MNIEKIIEKVSQGSKRIAKAVLPYFLCFVVLFVVIVLPLNQREEAEIKLLKYIPVDSHMITWEEQNPEVLYLNSGLGKANICDEWFFEQKIRELNGIKDTDDLLLKPGRILKVPWIN